MGVRAQAIRFAVVMVAAAAVCGCASQSGSSGQSWFHALFHPNEPARIVVPSRQIPERAQQWKDVQPEVGKAEKPPPHPTQPVAVQKSENPPAETPPPPAMLPRATVTSTMNAGNRQEAEAAIGEVNKRLAQAANNGGSDSQLSVIRKLRDSAQEAFNEQDYLTARSLAQKASVLAAQLPAAGPRQPSR